MAELAVLRKLCSGYIVLGFKSDIDSPAYISETFATFAEAEADEELCGYWISHIEAVNIRPWPLVAEVSQVRAAQRKDAVFDAVIAFVGELTGMTPPPIEVAPSEVFEPFRNFAERVCAIFSDTTGGIDAN